MVKVKFYDEVDDSLLKFAVIMQRQTINGCFASTGKEIHTRFPAVTEKTANPLWTPPSESSMKKQVQLGTH